ncbi:MAG: hypothetical protein QXN96_03150 [Candidatus Bathyarchaeia archaeon]|nr:hypothetical protein [Candidatus Parvarchaeum tengchongense]
MYDIVYECWRKENENSELTRLPDDFYPQIAEYLRRIREEMRMIDKKTLRGVLLRKELEDVKHMIWELAKLRYKKLAKKLIDGAKIPLDHLTNEEKEILKDISSLAHSYKSFVAELIQRQKLSLERTQTRKNVVVRFLKDIPSIVGLDLKVYGPFKVEDVASLPVENAEALIKRELARKISFSL